MKILAVGSGKTIVGGIFEESLKNQTPYIEKETVKIRLVRRGKWENEHYYNVLECFVATCSECGCESADPNSITNNHRYCEFCGAIMDGNIEKCKGR